MKSKIVLSFFVMSLIAFAAETEHGIFMRTVKNIKGNYNEVCNQEKQSMQSADFKLLADHDITSTGRVKKDKKTCADIRANYSFLQVITMLKC